MLTAKQTKDLWNKKQKENSIYIDREAAKSMKKIEKEIKEILNDPEDTYEPFLDSSELDNCDGKVYIRVKEILEDLGYEVNESRIHWQ